MKSWNLHKILKSFQKSGNLQQNPKISKSCTEFFPVINPSGMEALNTKKWFIKCVVKPLYASSWSELYVASFLSLVFGHFQYLVTGSNQLKVVKGWDWSVVTHCSHFMICMLTLNYVVCAGTLCRSSHWSCICQVLYWLHKWVCWTWSSHVHGPDQHTQSSLVNVHCVVLNIHLKLKVVDHKSL